MPRIIANKHVSTKADDKYNNYVTIHNFKVKRTANHKQTIEEQAKQNHSPKDHSFSCYQIKYSSSHNV